MTQRPDIRVGNATTDGIRGWFVGSMFDETFGLRSSDDVEIKWSNHAAGEERADWVTDEVRTAVAVLISGTFEVRFRDQSVVLAKPGDFVVWGLGHDHTYRSIENSVILTVRWPSVKPVA